MNEGVIGDNTAVLVSRLMTLTQERQQVISQNIANANTPGYTRLDLDFKDALARMARAGEMDRIRSFEGSLVEDPSNPARLDGNNVVIPHEMNAMMQNGIFHNLLGKVFTSRLGILKRAIEGGPSA